MPSADIVKSVPVLRTPRVAQLEGMFDLLPLERSEERWHVDLALPDEWNIGLIVGPSGSGKTTVARELFGDYMRESDWEWPTDKSILDAFPPGMGIKEIVNLLCSVGFSSPPSWLRPYRVLSTGEQFRVNVARALAEMGDVAVIDEFTSVVDRTVAKIASAAISKAVRRRGQRLVAVSCHYDIIDWLEPDWVYEPHTNELKRGRLRRRPPIELQVKRVHPDAWHLFAKHHYLSGELNKGARCFVAFWSEEPVAFSAWLNHPLSNSGGMVMREHRTVCLPDYQGVGIGNVLSDCCAAIMKSNGYRAVSTTSSQAMIAARLRSSNWLVRRAAGLNLGRTGELARARACTRLTVSFEYVGPSAPRAEARMLFNLNCSEEKGHWQYRITKEVTNCADRTEREERDHLLPVVQAAPPQGQVHA